MAYGEMAADLIATINALEVDRVLLIGGSMGLHTALRVALSHPERVAGIVGITPGFDPAETPSERDLHDAIRTANLVRRHGVEGFLRALEQIGDPLSVIAPDELRRRLSRHSDLEALANAIECVVRSRPFESLGDLAAIKVPTLIVGSRDKFDPRHPYQLAIAYAAALPRAELQCEPEGRAPIAWSRRRLGNLVLDFARDLSAGPWCPRSRS